MKNTIPKIIDNVEVERIGTAKRAGSGWWVTLIPKGSDYEGGDMRIWEFNLTTGDLVQTLNEEGD